MSRNAMYAKFVLLMLRRRRRRAGPRRRAVGPQLGLRCFAAPPSSIESARSSGSEIRKEEPMSRNAMYVKLVLLMLVLGAVAMFLGAEPWGRTELQARGRGLRPPPAVPSRA